MTVKERILRIRLQKKLNQYPGFVKMLGIEVSDTSSAEKEGKRYV